MKVIFYPAKSDSNDYVNLLVQALEFNNVQILNKDWNGDVELVINSLYTVLYNKNVIFHFNWLEDNGADSTFYGRIKCRLIIMFLFMFHCMGGHIVWTMHNAKAHSSLEAPNRQEKFIRNFLKYIDLVVVHCSESISVLRDVYDYDIERTLMIPHGNYCSAMNGLLEHHQEDNEKLHCLYFGAISKYKGVEKLLKAWETFADCGDMELRICGRMNDVNLQKNIEKESASLLNVDLHLKFLSNKDLAKQISWADVVILPYEKESMQNSGSAIMAISCGKPVIIPFFGYIKDIANQEFILGYDYDNTDEQIESLKHQIIRIKRLKNDKPEELRQIGQMARNFATSELNWNRIAGIMVEKYASL